MKLLRSGPNRVARNVADSRSRGRRIDENRRARSRMTHGDRRIAETFDRAVLGDPNAYGHTQEAGKPLAWLCQISNVIEVEMVSLRRYRFAVQGRRAAVH